jgi:hypothetical protein
MSPLTGLVQAGSFSVRVMVQNVTGKSPLPLSSRHGIFAGVNLSNE